jgi:hypothetical protein
MYALPTGGPTGKPEKPAAVRRELLILVIPGGHRTSNDADRAAPPLR